MARHAQNMHPLAVGTDPRRDVCASPINTQALAEAIEFAVDRCRQAVAAGDKVAIRELHTSAKQFDREAHYPELRALYARHRRYFPQPAQIDPERIDPILLPATHRTLEGQLFRVVRGYWSMPYSKGYGRRLRFVVFDRHHEAVIGILGLQSPSADLACRDAFLDVPKARKLEVVNNTLDAYTVGAAPAYAPLLAGKLVAGLLHSPVIGQAYWRNYGHGRTILSGARIPQPLLAITTASAFGRSSIYNRLRFGQDVLAKSLGYTKGFGTIHLEHLYPEMVEWLKSRERHVPAGFGNGPKVRWQNVMHAILGLGVRRDCLSHGIQREVFLLERVTNLLEVCRHGAIPEPRVFDDAAWTEYWKARWCIPRVARNPDWFEFDSHHLLKTALRY